MASDAAHAKLKELAEPEFRQIYLAYDEAADWDPADPRLEQRADRILALAAKYEVGPDAGPPDELAVDPVTMGLISPPGEMPPAWQRLDELCRERSKASRG